MSIIKSQQHKWYGAVTVLVLLLTSNPVFSRDNHNFCSFVYLRVILHIIKSIYSRLAYQAYIEVA